MSPIRRMLTMSVAALFVAAADIAMLWPALASPSAPGIDAPLFWPGTPDVIGSLQRHTIQEKETLLDIARRYDLGFNEIHDLHPQLDPWLPPRGRQIRIPTQWILPPGLDDGIVINIPELRLYCWDSTRNRVLTFPVSIGENAWPTPEGHFSIKAKQIDPGWVPPPSLQAKYGARFFPPGPDNPLGTHWLGLSGTHYGIHGTDFPWSIGRAVTRGCIRLYPEDIGRLFGQVQPGTPVRIIYAPVKLGIRANRVYVEVHRDIYNKVGCLRSHGTDLLRRWHLARRVDVAKYLQTLQRGDGMPVDVTR